jgi:hypothetical protein
MHKIARLPRAHASGTLCVQLFALFLYIYNEEGTSCALSYHNIESLNV